MKHEPYSQYLSPFSWRYGSAEMRTIFSEREKFRYWRKIWVALARVQLKAGFVSSKELTDIEKYEEDIDINRILVLEKETKHDVVAAIREFAEKAKVGGKKIHLGATSMDIVDNTDALRLKAALELVEKELILLIKVLGQKIEAYADLTCMAYTHLQPAEPTSLGYRFAVYAQDLLTDLTTLRYVQSVIKGKGFKGAVGTRGSYAKLLAGSKMSAADFDEAVMKELGISGVDIATQVYPRKFDYLAFSAIAGIGASLYKFASDVRILQQPAVGEWSEPFGSGQVGSSAMPFKRNPINSEKICSLGRYLGEMPAVALGNAMHSYLERTLDDSANKRVVFPEVFLCIDEMLTTAQKIVEGIGVHKERIEFNVAQYGPFAATEGILIDAVKAGADRQRLHEVLRTVSLSAWEEIQKGKHNTMKEKLVKNAEIRLYLTQKQIEALLDVSSHVGDAPARAKKLAADIAKL